jgi:uncharacterized peroxidase-related enzyme
MVYFCVSQHLVPLRNNNTYKESFNGVNESDVQEETTMPTFQTVEPTQATGETKKLFDALQNKLGMVPNLAKALANSPVSLKAYLGWGAALSGGVLPASLHEQIAIAVANTNGCDYCLSAHTVLGSLTGLAPDQLQDAQTGEASDPKAAAALGFAIKIVENRGHLPASEIEFLRSAGLPDSEIVEIVAAVSINIFTNYFNHIADTEIDFPVVHATSSVRA